MKASDRREKGGTGTRRSKGEGEARWTRKKKSGVSSVVLRKGKKVKNQRLSWTTLSKTGSGQGGEAKRPGDLMFKERGKKNDVSKGGEKEFLNFTGLYDHHRVCSSHKKGWGKRTTK